MNSSGFIQRPAAVHPAFAEIPETEGRPPGSAEEENRDGSFRR
jgi:hypothetical protein